MANNNNTKNLNVPNLRFPEFKGEWEDKKLGDLCSEFKSGKNIKSAEILEDGKFPVFGGNGLRGFTHKYNYNGEYVIVGRQGALCGNVRLVEGKCYMTEHAIVIKGSEDNNTKFLLYLLDKLNLGQYSDQSAQPGLAVNKLQKIKVTIPNLSEQNKIASFLFLLDQRIKTQIKIIEDLKVLQNTLIDYYYHHQRYDKNVSLFDCISQTSERNKKNNAFPVLSVSNKYGFIQQIEQFENRKVASEDISNYKIVRKNDFAYNPARINVGSIAKLIKYSNGIVSPMYICFRAKDNFLPDFLEFYFKSKQFKNEVLKRLEGSVRQCLPFEGLCDIPVVFPPKEKQKDIITQLSAIQTKIEIETTIKELQLKQKQHLLHQMLI